MLKVIMLFSSVVGLFCLQSFLPQSSRGNGIGEIFVAAVTYLVFFFMIYKIKKKNSNDLIWKLIMVVFILKAGLVFINYSVEFLPPKQDALQNIQMANDLADSWKNRDFSLTVAEPVELAYVIPIACINYFFGYNLYLSAMFNIFFSLIGIFFLYKTALVFAGSKEAITAALIFSLMPYLNFMSFAFNREIVIISIMIFLIHQTLVWNKSGGIIKDLLLAAIFIYLFCLREEAPVVIIFWSGLVMAANINISKDKLLGAVKITGLFMTVYLVCLSSSYVLPQNSGQNSGRGGGVLKQEFHINHISPQVFYDKAARHIDFGLAYLPENRPDSWSECLISYAPVQVLNFLTRPYPWEIFRFNQVFLVFNNFILYVLYALALFGMAKLILSGQTRKSTALLLFMIFSILPASLVHGNGFAASRHREQLIIFVYILAGIGANLFINRIKSTVDKQVK
jgi:hypothetical protein